MRWWQMAAGACFAWALDDFLTVFYPHLTQHTPGSALRYAGLGVLILLWEREPR